MRFEKISGSFSLFDTKLARKLKANYLKLATRFQLSTFINDVAQLHFVDDVILTHNVIIAMKAKRLFLSFFLRYYHYVIIFNQCHLYIGMQLFDTQSSNDYEAQQQFYPKNYLSL